MTTTEIKVQPLLVRVEEAAEMMALSRSTLYKMINKQELPSVKYGSARRIPVAAIHQWIEKNTQGC